MAGSPDWVPASSAAGRIAASGHATNDGLGGAKYGRPGRKLHYPAAMATLAEQINRPSAPNSLLSMFAWSRLRVAVGVSLVPWALMSFEWISGPHSLFIRTTALALAGLIAYGVFERWPKRLPGWLARWALQVAAVGLVMPLTMFVIYMWTTKEGAPPFWKVQDRLVGFGGLSFLGMLLGPWVALTALVRQKDALARHQALALELQSSQLERQALESRLRLLQAQVSPHFLFNTLANVREHVQNGSPQAPAVLDSLIAYLRAAVPRLHDPATTIADELQLARAYLEVMHMRIPDRLQFELQADDAALTVRCPSMTLLTLVENAVRHGIDPSEAGGRIEVRVQLRDARCLVQVRDSGAGLRAGRAGLGTGLETLRERLQLTFGDAAQLRVEALQPRGVVAEVEFPAQ